MADKITPVTPETFILRDQLKSHMLKNQQLHEANLARKQALADMRDQLAQTRNRARCLRAPTPIILPNQAFTIRELETVNPAMAPEDVRVHLATEISLRRVEFFTQGQNNEPVQALPESFMYRVAPHPALRAP